MINKFFFYLAVVCETLYAGVLTICCGFIALFYRRKELWLFRERGTDARDNAYWMFRYIKEQHPEIEAYYAITQDSPDRERLSPWADCIVNQNSFRHYLYMWLATHILSTHICGGYPNRVRRTYLLYYFVTWLSPKKTIWLQHGVILNDVGLRASRYNNLDMIVSSTYSEYEYLCKRCGYTDKEVKLAGLARWDQLHDCKFKRNQILFMPTWRKWLNTKNFVDSEYFKVISEFLKMTQLHNFLEGNGLSLVFYPHHEVQKFIHHFSALPLSTSITVADKAHYDVLQLLKESALLITDYSSISIDFVYMQKPVIYFPFDKDLFRKEHYASRGFDYLDAFGPYATTCENLLSCIEELYRSNMKMDSKFLKRAEQAFPLNDLNNCKRIYAFIHDEE